MRGVSPPLHTDVPVPFDVLVLTECSDPMHSGGAALFAVAASSQRVRQRLRWLPTVASSLVLRDLPSLLERGKGGEAASSSAGCRFDRSHEIPVRTVVPGLHFKPSTNASTLTRTSFKIFLIKGLLRSCHL